MLGGTFDAEQISNGWSEDIKLPFGSIPPTLDILEESRAAAGENGELGPADSAVARYEGWCREPTSGGLPNVESAVTDAVIGVESDETQAFFERQFKILEAYKAKAPTAAVENTGGGAYSKRADAMSDSGVNEHIGPVQFNMGGIQVDADDMLQRLKV